MEDRLSTLTGKGEKNHHSSLNEAAQLLSKEMGEQGALSDAISKRFNLALLFKADRAARTRAGQRPGTSAQDAPHRGAGRQTGQRARGSAARRAIRRSCNDVPRLMPEAAPEACQARRVTNRRRCVRHIAIQIRIGRIEADRVLADPLPYFRIIPAVEVVL